MTSSDEARALVNALRAKADPYKDNTLLDAADLIERLTTPPTADEREALLAIIDTWWNSPRLGATGSMSQADTIALRDLILQDFRRQGPITDEWEYGAVYQGHNGEWFAMDGAFAIREAAEREVERYADAQIVLGRRRKADPWEPVEAAREVEKNEE